MNRLALLTTVIVLLFAGASVSQADPAEPPMAFHPPIRLMADGNLIDSGPDWGHCGPCIEDLDGDGLDDLIVGDFGGKFRYYRNVGAPAAAESSTAEAPAPADPASDPGQHDQAGPVHCRLELPDAALSRGHDFELAVLIAIDPPYEIYDLGARSPAVATSLTLELPPGFHASQSWSVPKTVPSASPMAHPVYAGQVRFTRGIRIDPSCEPGVYQLGCSVTYQACTARQCLRPAQCALSAEVKVGP